MIFSKLVLIMTHIWFSCILHCTMKLHEFHQSPWFLHVREPATLGHWLWMYISKQAQMSLFLSNSKIPLYAHPLCSGYSTVLLCHPSSGNRLPELQQADTQCSGASGSINIDQSETYQLRCRSSSEAGWTRIWWNLGVTLLQWMII